MALSVYERTLIYSELTTAHVLKNPLFFLWQAGKTAARGGAAVTGTHSEEKRKKSQRSSVPSHTSVLGAFEMGAFENLLKRQQCPYAVHNLEYFSSISFFPTQTNGRF